MTTEPTSRELLATLSRLPGRQARLDWLLAEAATWPPLTEAARTDDRRVPGCLSRLWLVAELRAGQCWFEADSDSRIVRALAGLMCRLYRGQTPAEILSHAALDLEALGLSLATANRRNALSRVELAIRDFARSAITAPEHSTSAPPDQAPPGT